MEYCLFRTIGKYTFWIIECARPRALNMPKKRVFHMSDYLHSADSLKKYIFEIPPFFNSQFSGGNTRKLRVFFLHTNATLEVKNRVQFAWAKVVGPGSPPKGRAVGGGRAPDPGRPTPRQEAPPPGALVPPPQRQSQLARARAVGLVMGPHARTPLHPQPVGSGLRQPAQRAGSRGRGSA